MKKIVFFSFLLCLLTNCKNKQQNVIVERIAVPVTSVCDSLESVMPGELFLTESYILWTNPFNSDLFVHVLDKYTGTEIAKFGKVGQGPDEFVTPSVFLHPNNCLFVYDLNRNKQFLYSIDSVVHRRPEIIKKEKEEFKNINRILFTDEETFISFDSSAEVPFTIRRGDQHVSFGEQAIKGKINDGFSHFQGEMRYNPVKECFIYTTFKFPYLAVYEKQKEKFRLAKEALLTDEYEVDNGNFSYKGERRGASGLALTSDYIVTLERDRKFDTTDESKIGRDFSKLSHTVFLYDYDLQLRKIVDLGMPILRIAAEPETNQLYAIGVNPDFVLIKCDL